MRDRQHFAEVQEIFRKLHLRAGSDRCQAKHASNRKTIVPVLVLRFQDTPTEKIEKKQSEKKYMTVSAKSRAFGAVHKCVNLADLEKQSTAEICIFGSKM